MSQLEVDKIIPQSGTTLTIGDSGDTVNFADGTALSIDTNTLYIDSTNNRVGIGTTSPSTVLDVRDETNGANFIVGGSGTTNITKIGGGAGDSLQLFTNSTTPVMLLSTSGNVGIGTTSPSTKLDVEGTGVPIEINSSNSNTYKIQFADNGTVRGYIGSSSATPIRFANSSASELMRINSSGNVLVGKTSEGSDNVGVENRGDGLGIFTRDGNTPIIINRKTSDGDLINLKKDGTTVGIIGTNQDDLVIGNGDVGFRFYDSAGQSSILPRTSSGGSSDNNLDLGSSVSRWENLYLGGGLYVGGTGTANKLDDYEEGTWTPVFAGSTTAGSYTYTTQVGTYTKVGRKVTVNCELLNITEVSAASGSCKITGLPFTASSTNNSFGACDVNRISFTGYNYCVANLGTSKNFVYILRVRTGNTSAILDVSHRDSDQSDIKFTITYEV